MKLKAIALIALFSLAAYAQTTARVRFTATSQNVSGAGESIKINLTGWSSETQRDELVAAWTLTAPAAAPAGGRGGRGGGGGGGGRGGGRGGRGARGGADANTTAPAAPAAAAADLPADPDAVDPDSPAFRFGRGGARGRTDAAATTPEASLAAALKKAPTIGILWTSEIVGYSIKYAYRMPQPDGGERIILATDRRVGVWSALWKPSSSIPVSDYPFSIIELHVNAKGEGEARGVMAGKVAVDGAAKTIALDGYPALPVILRGVKRSS